MFLIKLYKNLFLENLEISGNFEKCDFREWKCHENESHLKRSCRKVIEMSKYNILFFPVRLSSKVFHETEMTLYKTITNIIKMYRSKKVWTLLTGLMRITNHAKNGKHIIISYTSLQPHRANITDILSTWRHFCQNVTVIVTVKLHVNDFSITLRPSPPHIIYSE